ncbi:unnamed protein product [Durusdinium trenchii]|uniref:Phosphagen kinase C-terminal domain-containing protein n=1 Tax=Durusdinium trenchii TaxID=1381693 RepID=A0ABP0PBT0_9DINO
MEVVVQAASEVPQGCFVSVRLGEHLKQRRFNKNTATYYFPAVEDKGKARVDVYQLVGTCSIPIDPAVAETKEVSVIGSDPDSEVLKLRVSTANKEIKAEDTQRQRQEIETETKDAAVGYLAKHGIEQKLSECLRTMLRMKPEEPIDFMCKFLTGGKFVPEESSSPVQQGKPEAPPAPTAPPAETAPPTPAAGPPEAAQPDARAALMKSVRAGDLIGAVEEEDKLNVPFALRPSVGTWLMPLSLDQVSHTTPEASQLHRRGSTEPEVAIGDWLLAPNGSFNLKGLGHTSMECCALMHELPGGLSSKEKDSLASKKLLFESFDAAGRGIYVTEKEDVALWVNAEKHLQILVHQSAQGELQHKVAMVVSALQGPLIQDGYTLSP